MNARTAPLRRSRKAGGFTLIELMVTVAVAIILLGIGVPSFRSMIASERMSSESFDIVAMLTQTRSEAIKRNASVTSTPNEVPPSGSKIYNWKRGWVITGPVAVPATCTPGSTLPACAAGTTTISTKDALGGSDITITCFQGTTALTSCSAITFNANGRLSAGTAQSIQILSSSLPASGGQNARCVSIDLSGQARSKKGTC